jgi:two-component system, chemotaxis family, chemotaxis protein CheY
MEAERFSAPVRILLVDDSSLVRLYYRGALESAGYEVAQAMNGVEALEKVLAERFDLLIVDVNMPGMDGLSFIRALRSGAAATAGLPALVITTEAAAEDRDDARAVGANFYLVKPVSEPDLRRHVAILTGAPG